MFPVSAMGMVLLLAACAHSPPQAVQVFSQVNRVFDPSAGTWTTQLSVFVQATSADGQRVFDRLHLIHDDQGLFLTLGRDQWSQIDRPGEFWVGANGIAFPTGTVPTGAWRALLVTRAGLRTEIVFQVPPLPIDAPGARGAPVLVRQDPQNPGQYLVSGWIEDYLVWARDAKGAVLTRNKTVGGRFPVPAGTSSITLYSYDKNRGEGLVAGPFPVKEPGDSADR